MRPLAGVVFDERQQRPQIVSAPFPELVQHVAGPVGLVHLEAVAEDCVNAPVARRSDQLVADLVQVFLDCRAIVVIEHVTLGSKGRALDDLTGVAREVENQRARTGARRNLDRSIP